MTKPRLLDLFCCAGGAAMGYHRAGFEVVGVDIKPQPHYPFEFHQADALTYPLDGFDAYHASPPCQRFSTLTPTYAKSRWPDLIDIVRQRLIGLGKPFVIENVPGAKNKLINPLMFCGSMVGLPIWRHRYFEINPPYYPLLNTCNHKLGTTEWNGEIIDIPVYISAGGDSLKGPRPSRLTIRHRPRQVFSLRCSAMGIDWMTNRHELSEAIPPAYTEFIGKYLMQEVLK
jgi:DNA (cytosine-5)-methyltransferase 1